VTLEYCRGCDSCSGWAYDGSAGECKACNSGVSYDLYEQASSANGWEDQWGCRKDGITDVGYARVDDTFCCEACVSSFSWSGRRRTVQNGDCPDGYVPDGKPGYSVQSGCCLAEYPEYTGGEYTEIGNGVAGPTEIWNVGGAKGKGVEACYQAVLQDRRCNGYFTYVHGGDLNCGCKGSTASLSIRPDGISTYYSYQGGAYYAFKASVEEAYDDYGGWDDLR